MIKDTSGQDITITQPRSLLKRFKWWVATAIGMLLFSATAIPSLVSLYSTEMQFEAAQLRYATVEQGHFVRDVTVQGRVIAAISPTFYALADGTVSLNVKAGDEIQQGQILAAIDSPTLNNQLEQQQSLFETMALENGRQKIESDARLLNLNQQADLTAVDLEAAEREMQRAQLSHKDSLISDVEFEQVQVALKKAKLTARHAKQNLALEKERLQFELQTLEQQLARQKLVVEDLSRQVGELSIKAPFDGVVGNIEVQQQQAVTRNTPLLTAVDMTAFEIEALIPENYADEMGSGLRVDVSVGGNTSIATLAAISPEVVDGQVIGRIRFEQTPAGLRQNQRISARIFIESKNNVLKVKRGAFVESSGGRVAYVLNQNVAVRTDIVTGSYSTGEIEVLSGLVAGDRIVISNTSQFNNHERIYLTQ